MFAPSKVLFLLLSSTVFFLGACSQDEGDGKDDKGGKQMTASAVSLNEAPVLSSVRCASNDELRNQCYRDLLKASPELINELNSQNPFLLKTWDHTDFSNSTMLKEITNCRVSYPNSCN